ncbi:HNH endonuclease signature motif containing protein [Labedella endophytica]|uniref:HNH endonuclease n=1 Tax=Labedella endophytica TaxID=1523160 RepID=A0A3S0VVM5_9MICO|nr:HNH endonuclease signature motif containing protein [Labedella endophytica]RUR03153.1 HNH endonuclease [Labedella endophytica]
MTAHGTTQRTAISDLIARFDATVSALDPARFSGPEFMAIVSQIEAFGRRADALRVRVAAEATRRVDGPVDTLGAAGYASAEDGIAKLTGASETDAARRIRVGLGVVPGASLTGSPTAPRHPVVAAAVATGALGIEAADILMKGLDSVASRVDPVTLAETEESLVGLAVGSDTQPPLGVDLVRIQLATFLLRIEPDGARPREKRAQKSRRLTFGVETVDGLIPVSGLLMAEVGATFKRLVDAHGRKVAFLDGAETAPAASDDRTPPQRRHDTLADILSAASRVKDAPELAGSAPAVLVAVTQSTLDDGRGVGFIDGHVTPISIDTVERLIDSRGLQAVALGPTGRVLALGSTQRCFTSAQRRAITVRDGGCVIPGCTTPAGWCEVHHVIPWRAGGQTHTDNGVLLCWGHHQRIDSGPWRLSMPDGVPHVRGPGQVEWTPTGQSRVRTLLSRTG